MLHRSDWIIITALFAIVNGLSRSFFISIGGDGFINAALQGFGLNAITLLAIVAALYLLRKNNIAASSVDIGLSVTTMLICCIPSAMLCWSALALYSLYYVFCSKADTALRAGCVLLFALAFREPLVLILLKYLAPYVLSLDAVFAQQLAAWFGLDSIRQDNMIHTQSGRSILILAPCSSVSNLSLALLLWLTVARWLSYRWQRCDSWAVSTIVAAVLLCNWIRLAVMIISQPAYHFLHGETGKMLFEFAMMIVIVSLIWRFYAAHIHHKLRDRSADSLAHP